MPNMNKQFWRKLQWENLSRLTEWLGSLQIGTQFISYQQIYLF